MHGVHVSVNRCSAFNNIPGTVAYSALQFSPSGPLTQEASTNTIILSPSLHPQYKITAQQAPELHLRNTLRSSGINIYTAHAILTFWEGPTCMPICLYTCMIFSD